MRLRQLSTAVAVSAAVPLIIYLLLLGAQAVIKHQETDFQYHDSYFLVLHVGWVGYGACFLLCFALYLAIFAVFRAIRRASR
ncbi:hypothetical protein [Paenibacillus sp. R14(2021)]|uniref:hypothetical protein n=1 Tax=Paenibacillus sp. R14(2021) TaxID=2859228 RepID=UPI001C6115A0|nr:hypothetical protein [Paenibacillus sp. R14(2021)]